MNLYLRKRTRSKNERKKESERQTKSAIKGEEERRQADGNIVGNLVPTRKKEDARSHVGKNQKKAEVATRPTRKKQREGEERTGDSQLQKRGKRDKRLAEADYFLKGPSHV